MACRDAEIAARLRQVREALNKTQAEMAQLVDVSMSAWQKYEYAENLPGARSLARLLELGIDANWVLTGAGSMFLANRGQPFLSHHAHAGPLTERAALEPFLEAARIGKAVREAVAAVRRSSTNLIELDGAEVELALLSAKQHLRWADFRALLDVVTAENADAEEFSDDS